MPKILHIARPLTGVGVYISLVCKYIHKDFENIIICNESEENMKLEDSDKNEIKSYHAPIVRKISFLNDLKCLIKIIKIIKITNPDIIHCHSAKGGILGRVAGFITHKKTFYTPHAYSYLSTESKTKKTLYKFIEFFLGCLPSKTLACSKSEYKKAIFDLKLNKNKVLVWENSIEDIASLPLNTNSYRKKPFICSVGRPSFQKNTELLVASILEIKKTISNIHLVLLGVGFYSPSLKKINDFIKNNNLNDNITLIPWIDRQSSLSILRQSTIFVSTSRYEGLSYATLEALAFSKPCVLTNVDGNKEAVVNGRNGFLVDENKEDISKKIIQILKDELLINSMSLKSRELYEKFYNIKINIKYLEKLYLN